MADVDVVADVEPLGRDDLAVIAYAIQQYGLPENLKLSVHSGSDKFSVFPIIGDLTNGRFHVKTAGTNWLEAMRVVAIEDAELFRQESNRLNIRKHEGLSDTYRSKMFALLTDTGSKSMKQLKTRFWQVGYATTPNVSLVGKKTCCEYIPSILCLKLYFYFVHL